MATKYDNDYVHSTINHTGLMYTLAVALILIFGIYHSPNGHANSLQVIGNAYDLKGKKFLYREEHYFSSGTIRDVRYISKNGELIAHKTLDYELSKISPSYRLVNLWSNNDTEVEWENGLLTMRHFPSGTDRTEQFKSSKVLSHSEPIIDAGFDNLIKKNWEGLNSGKKTKIDFVLASKRSTLKLSIKRELCKDPQDHSDQVSQVCFIARPTNWVLSMVAPPIELYYDQNRNLVRFKGTSNIADKNGKLLKVDIKYTYQEVSQI